MQTMMEHCIDLVALSVKGFKALGKLKEPKSETELSFFRRHRTAELNQEKNNKFDRCGIISFASDHLSSSGPALPSF